MYEDEAIKNKKDIVLDLSDTEATAKICKALSSETRLEILKCLVDKSMTISELAEVFYLPMSSMCLHIKTLSEANLITVVPKPGLRGSQKLCGIKTANVTLDIFAHLNKLTRKPPVYVNMPIGHYSYCHILPPCGIASAASYVYYEDSPYGFYSPDRTDAALIWLTSGFLEYQFSNYPLQQDKVTQIEFSFEICSEAPGYNNNWPSDITVELNGKKITTFHIKGDYGGRKVLLVVNTIYTLFETFGIVHAVTQGGPSKATETLIYKVFNDGFIGLDFGGSSAQSVVLMLIVMVLTFLQFRYVERKVTY